MENEFTVEEIEYLKEALHEEKPEKKEEKKSKKRHSARSTAEEDHVDRVPFTDEDTMRFKLALHDIDLWQKLHEEAAEKSKKARKGGRKTKTAKRRKPSKRRKTYRK